MLSGCPQHTDLSWVISSRLHTVVISHNSALQSLTVHTVSLVNVTWQQILDNIQLVCRYFLHISLPWIINIISFFSNLLTALQFFLSGLLLFYVSNRFTIFFSYSFFFCPIFLFYLPSLCPPIYLDFFPPSYQKYHPILRPFLVSLIQVDVKYTGMFHGLQCWS
jgi:hypothetical protein